mmetsp:Transcript_2897/g.8125  ORF Transcript_2897/g.8125 Transcript_2897/m.8125 type:complete len:243 (-) Transcript_2897:2493-3221(-)
MTGASGVLVDKFFGGFTASTGASLAASSLMPRSSSCDRLPIIALMSDFVFLRVRRPRPPLLLATSTSFSCCILYVSSKVLTASDVTCFLSPRRITKPAGARFFLPSSSSFWAIKTSRAWRVCCSSNLLEASRTASRIWRWVRYSCRLTCNAVFCFSPSTATGAPRVCSRSKTARLASLVSPPDGFGDSISSLNSGGVSSSSPIDRDRFLMYTGDALIDNWGNARFGLIDSLLTPDVAESGEM